MSRHQPPLRKEVNKMLYSHYDVTESDIDKGLRFLTTLANSNIINTDGKNRLRDGFLRLRSRSEIIPYCNSILHTPMPWSNADVRDMFI